MVAARVRTGGEEGDVEAPEDHGDDFGEVLEGGGVGDKLLVVVDGKGRNKGGSNMTQ